MVLGRLQSSLIFLLVLCIVFILLTPSMRIRRRPELNMRVSVFKAVSKTSRWTLRMFKDDTIQLIHEDSCSNSSPSYRLFTGLASDLTITDCGTYKLGQTLCFHDFEDVAVDRCIPSSTDGLPCDDHIEKLNNHTKTYIIGEDESLSCINVNLPVVTHYIYL
jgi:hypothetical protein